MWPIIETFYQSGMIGLKKGSQRFLFLVSSFLFLLFLFFLLLFLLGKFMLRLSHFNLALGAMAEQDREQRRDLRLEATELFVLQKLSANLGPVASRPGGNLFRQRLANERYANDMTFRVLNNLSGQERADFIHFAESK